LPLQPVSCSKGIFNTSGICRYILDTSIEFFELSCDLRNNLYLQAFLGTAQYLLHREVLRRNWGEVIFSKPERGL
jgi:hypothetical protein